LHIELGVEPSKTTEALYEEIVNWESSAFPVDDPLPESSEKPALSVVQDVYPIPTTTPYRKMFSRSVIFSILFILVLGISIVPGFRSRKETQLQTPVNATISSVSSENKNAAPDNLQSTESTTPEQASPLSPMPLNPGTELEVLIALYENTGGPHWVNSEGWLSDLPTCDWFGVICRGDKIVELELSNNQLNGSLPAELGGLEYLENLDLGNNQLSGSIPPELGKLSRLKHLVLWGNRQLSGPIPPALGNLSNLEHLWLANWESGGSLLSGEIPPELGKLKNLRSLQISVSLLRGSMPVELCSLINLEDLYLDSNQLSGSIPPEIGDMISLGALDLGGNDFEGPIPPEIGNLPMLTFLAFGGSLVSGEIPPELGNLVRLRHLVLDNTKLSGPLPLALMNLQLRELTFFGTQVCEPVDEDFQIWLKSIHDLKSSEIICKP
jgi:Leucine-rich repeat (LRR) protein